MSYRFEENETVGEAIKRISLEQSQKALERLKSNRNRDKAIHDARVRFKKMRALLKLIRGEIDEGTYRQENLCYRDAGRQLSSVRDSAAMVETLDKLVERFGDQLSPGVFEGIRKSFMKSKRKRQVEKKKIMSEVARTIRTAGRGIESWSINNDDFSALRGGVRRVYKQGRASIKLAYDQPGTEQFHEWRKHAKNLFYQVRILRPIWPDVLGGMSGEVKKLAGYLSDEHDLALLHDRVTEVANESVDIREIEVIVPLINQRREEIQKIARPLGERIYVERPKAFVGRFEAYWEAWRSEGNLKSMATS
jgi:CHAD domain-containing protein